MDSPPSELPVVESGPVSENTGKAPSQNNYAEGETGYSYLHIRILQTRRALYTVV